MPESLKTSSQFEIREELQEMVIRELLGPAQGEYEEIVEQQVSDRYLVGMLAPLNQPMGQDEIEELAEGGPPGGEEGSPEPDAIHNTKILPSSIGLTFTVDGEAKSIVVIARWGQYDRVESETLTTENLNPKKIWKRKPVAGISEPIPLQEGQIPNWSPYPDNPEVIVRGRTRKSQDGLWIVTLFLVNQQTEPKQLRDAAWIFQPQLIVKSSDGKAIFCKEPIPIHSKHLDPLTKLENETMAMLYRHEVEFAVGHGVSVYAETDPDDSKQAMQIETKVMPIHEVPKQVHTTPNEEPALEGVVLDMKELAEMGDAEFSEKLGKLSSAYADWIAQEKQKTDDPEIQNYYKSAASESIKRCEEIQKRIQEGLDLLTSNPQAAEAFRFANQAMYPTNRIINFRHMRNSLVASCG